MVNQEKHNNLISEIRQGLIKMSEYDVQSIINVKELGNQFSFKEAEPSIINTLTLFKRINAQDLEEIPYNLLSVFNGQLQDAISRIEQMISFNPINQGNPVAQRNSLIQSIQNQYQEYFQHSMPIILSQMLKSNDLSIQQARYNQIIEELENQRKKDLNKSAEYLDQMQRAVKSTQDAAAKSGVTKYSALFKVESDIHMKKATFWLRCTIFVLLAIIVVAFILIKFFPDSNTEVANIIQYTISKIIVLSALFYGLNLCNKNFKAHRHNEVINKHRQNALASFETFTNAAGSDIQTKNAVLLEATKTIFSNQQTGYLSNYFESDSSNRIIEIFKGVTSRVE